MKKNKGILWILPDNVKIDIDFTNKRMIYEETFNLPKIITESFAKNSLELIKMMIPKENIINMKTLNNGVRIEISGNRNSLAGFVLSEFKMHLPKPLLDTLLSFSPSVRTVETSERETIKEDLKEKIKLLEKMVKSLETEGMVSESSRPRA